MNEASLLALRARFSVAAEQRQVVARGEEFAATLAMIAGEVSSPDNRKGSAAHLLALTDKALAGLRERAAGDETPDFSNMSKEELYKLAQKHDIDGRSEMDKPNLIKAVKRAWKKAFGPKEK